VPAAADPELLTTLLRDDWGFTGTVVADYFGIAFLQLLHGVAGSEAEAAGLALASGVDVDLPTRHCYGDPLLGAVRDGSVPEELVDRAARRVLAQKIELGLLDPGWSPVPSALLGADGSRDGDVTEGSIDLDPPAAQALSRAIAEKSVVLLANAGVLPLAASARLAVVGPNAHDPMAMLGCYSFPSHVGVHHPDVPMGVAIPTLLESLRAELPGATIDHAPGCDVSAPGRDGFASAVELAGAADVCIAVLGDFAALFGRGTSGEGCDAGDLSLPGEQGALLEALLATRKPVVLVMLSGRPYALAPYADRLAAVVQGFFPGQSGGPAVAGVLSGRVNPSGRLPIEFPRLPSDVTLSYLAAPLGHHTEVSSIDPTPLWSFGHGLGYSSFEWSDARADATEIGTDGEVTVSCVVANTGDRAGADVVQLYLHDPVAQVTRPVVRLVGFARVELEPGESRRVSLRVHADLTSFAGRSGSRIVEPGLVELRLGRSAAPADVVASLPVQLVGPERSVGFDRVLFSAVEVAAV